MDEVMNMQWFDLLWAPRLGVRTPTMRFVVQWLLDLERPVHIVETGCMRVLGNWADGQSTMLWDAVCDRIGSSSSFASIDISVEATELCKQATRNGKIICNDSVHALGVMPMGGIDLLYLDSYDFDINNPIPSAAHHLMELTAVYGRLQSGCLIMVDDCHSENVGKHQLVHEFFRHLGVNPIVTGYQYIWRKP